MLWTSKYIGNLKYNRKYSHVCIPLYVCSRGYYRSIKLMNAASHYIYVENARKSVVSKMSKPRLHLVVAACKNGGIGINGNIPWRLKQDMEMFKKLTSETTDPSKKNAVIMGRKTWLSIPHKFRPLRKRVNIILSTSMNENPDGAYVVKSFKDAMDLATSEKLKDQVESIHVIGGSRVYKEAMESPYDCRVYLTKIDAEFECDTFLSDLDENIFKRVKNPPNIPEEVQLENDIKFTYEVYDKVYVH